MGGADACHVLAHRTDVIVLVGVVVEAIVMEGIGLVARTMFKVEAVVFDVGLHSGLVHEAVVLFRAIAGVGDGDRGQVLVTAKERAKERYQREGIGGIGKQGEVGDELVLGGDLKVVAGLGLSVVHRVLLHPHERGVGVCLRHGVALAYLLQAAVILFELVAVLFQFLHLLASLALPFLFLPCPQMPAQSKACLSTR